MTSIPQREHHSYTRLFHYLLEKSVTSPSTLVLAAKHKLWPYNFLKFSGDYKSGLGDPDNVNGVQWENMTKENIQSSKHRFEMTIPHDPSQVPAARRSFL
jgi:hypothetical protein